MKEKVNDIIYNILSGNSSTDDELFLIDWLGENDENLKYFTEKERLWNALEITLNRKNFNYRTAFEKFRSAIRGPAKRKDRMKLIIRNLSGNLVKLAATGLILLALGSITTFFIIDHINHRKPETYKVAVPTGSRTNLTLADGTTVWLNAESKLTYSGNFGRDDRVVHLEGEGYFDVAQNSNKPFKVVTSQLELVALGTSFNVKSYPGENIIQTTLVSGSLQINRSMYKSAERGLLLEPNQQITYYKDTRDFLLEHNLDDKLEIESEPEPETVKDINKTRLPEKPLPKITLRHDIDTEIFTSWKDNRLIFDNEPFESIAVKLERRFGIKIIINDKEIKNIRFKGIFDEITIEQALSALKFASPFEFQIKEDAIYISN